MSTAKKLLVRAAAESQVGNARGNNEDNVYFNGDFITPRNIRQDFAIKTGEYSDVNCFAVMDGMGRNNTGSYASLLAATKLDEIADRVAFDTGRDPDELVLEYIQSANDEIRQQIRETGGVRTATTLALLIIENGVAHAYNAGDSRIYLYRDRQLVKLTRDHVMVKGQRSVSLTEEGVRNGGLTKYLGMAEEDGSLEPYRAKPFKVKKGDKFLICSDGITDYVDEEDIAECLSKRKDPFGHTNELIGLALREESADNISAVVVEIVEPGFHVTQNMILVALGCIIFLFGMLVGGLFGYIMGGGNKTNAFVDNNMSVTLPIQPNDPDDYDDPQVSGSDVVSGSDTPIVDIQDDDSSGSTASRTTYPTTTYPTTTEAPIMVELFNLTVHDFTIRQGKTTTIGIQIIPSDTPMTAIKWESSDPSKVTVDEYGKVTAVARGKAKITATVGDLSDSCIVRVSRG